MKHSKTILGFPNDKFGNVCQVFIIVLAIVMTCVIIYEDYSPVAKLCQSMGGEYWAGNSKFHKCVKSIDIYLDIEGR